MIDKSSYFNYLQKRSRVGFLYRKFILYPRLNSYLNGKVLDIGCGIGDFLDSRKNIIGVDINEESVNWCCTLGHNAILMKKDILPFDNQSFDAIVMDNVLEHIENPKAILNEANRILVDAGIILLGVPGSLGYLKDTDHKIFYTQDKLIETLKDYGFEERYLFSMPLNFKWLDRILSQYCLYGIFVKTKF
jgi:SAM-dependent methyltransferase